MNEQILCISMPGVRTYYKAIPVAKEFLDKDNNIVNTTGQIPDAKVIEFSVSSATAKHFKNNKLHGKLEVMNLVDRSITFSEEYENGKLVRVTEQTDPSLVTPETKSAPLYTGTILKSNKDVRAFYVDGKQIAEETISSNGATLELLGSIPDGEVKELAENGKLRMQAVYKNNKLNGPLVRFNEEEQILSQETYEDGILKGQATYNSYMHNNCLRTDCFYKNAVLDGALTVTQANGTIREKSTYVKGRLNGKRACFYADGTQELAETYEDGKLQGERQIFFPSGQLWYREHYINGRLDGERTEFFKNGKICLSEFYSEGLLNGQRSLYDEQGNVLSQDEFHWGNIVHNTEYRPQ